METSQRQRTKEPTECFGRCRWDGRTGPLIRVSNSPPTPPSSSAAAADAAVAFPTGKSDDSPTHFRSGFSPEYKDFPSGESRAPNGDFNGLFCPGEWGIGGWKRTGENARTERKDRWEIGPRFFYIWHFFGESVRQPVDRSPSPSKNFKVGVFFFVKRDDFFALPAWYVLLPIQARRAITRGCEKWEEEA